VDHAETHYRHADPAVLGSIELPGLTFAPSPATEYEIEALIPSFAGLLTVGAQAALLALRSTWTGRRSDSSPRPVSARQSPSTGTQPILDRDNRADGYLAQPDPVFPSAGTTARSHQRSDRDERDSRQPIVTFEYWLSAPLKGTVAPTRSGDDLDRRPVTWTVGPSRAAEPDGEETGERWISASISYSVAGLGANVRPGSSIDPRTAGVGRVGSEFSVVHESACGSSAIRCSIAGRAALIKPVVRLPVEHDLPVAAGGTAPSGSTAYGISHGVFASHETHAIPDVSSWNVNVMTSPAIGVVPRRAAAAHRPGRVRRSRPDPIRDGAQPPTPTMVSAWMCL